MTSYTLKKLIDVCRIVMGQSPPSATYSLTQVGLPFLQGKAEFGVTHPSPRLFCSQPNKIGKADTVLLSVRAPVGAVNLADQDYCIGRGLCSLENRFGPSRYVLYALIHGETRLNKLATGTTFVSVTKGSVEGFPIPYPEPAIQSGIVQTLDAIQAGRLARLREIELERERKAALMAHLFAYGTKNEPRRDTPLGPLPDSWDVRPLDELATVQTGLAKNKKAEAIDSVELPYLRVANVQDGYLDLSEMKTVRVAKSALNRFLLSNGDVLLTEGGDFDKLGRGFIWRGQISPCLHQNHVFAVRTNRKVLSPEFLTYYCQAPAGKAYFLSVAHKTTNLACINTTKLRALPVPTPTIEEQEEIALSLSKSDALIRALEGEAKLLDELFRVTLEELMSGRLSVSPLLQEVSA